VPTQRSATALALGAWIGVRMTWATDRAPAVVEDMGELTVAVPDQESDRRGVVVKGGEKVAGLLGDPRAGGVGGDARQLHAPGLQLNEEQHVQPLQEHGVHGEEVARQDAGCLLA
jgi:hypothetical protein